MPRPLPRELHNLPPKRPILLHESRLLHLIQQRPLPHLLRWTPRASLCALPLELGDARPVYEFPGAIFGLEGLTFGGFGGEEDVVCGGLAEFGLEGLDGDVEGVSFGLGVFELGLCVFEFEDELLEDFLEGGLVG